MTTSKQEERIPLTGSGSEIALHDVPAIPGLRFRRFRGDADLPVMLNILNACKEADNLQSVFTLENLKRNYAYQPNCNFERDMIFIEVNDEPAGYGRAWWWQEDDGPRIYYHFAWIVPAWRGQGIGRAVLRWQEDHLRALAADHDFDGERMFCVDSEDDQDSKNALLKHAGYRIVAYVAEMVRPDLENILDLPLPDGLEVRPVEPEHYRAIWEAEQEAFRDHFGYVAPQEGDYEHYFLGHPYFAPDMWKIAWDGDQVAGMVRSFIDEESNREFHRKRGYTEHISVRRAWRRRGLASALLALSLKEVKAHGMEEAALGVHTDNPNGAFDLYEKAGFRVTKMYLTLRKPMG